MKKTLIFIVLIFAIGLLSIPLVFSDNDGRWDEYKQHSIGVSSISSPVYKEECGSCHMAYPAGLLSSQSWRKIMTDLEDHFADNAELDAQSQQSISKYLLNNSAEKSNYRRSRKFLRGISKNETPMRITQTPYFKHEHDEIPAKMVKTNQQVKSFSNCNACHQKAQQGLFDEDNIRIPGYGHWDD